MEIIKNNKEAVKVLVDNYQYICQSLRSRYLNNSSNQKYSLKDKTHIKERLKLFDDVTNDILLDPKSSISLMCYKLPIDKDLSTEGVINDYKRGLYTNILPIIYLRVEQAYKNKRKQEARYIPMSHLSTINDNGEEEPMEFDSGVNLEENVLNGLMQKTAELIVNNIQNYLCLTDIKILNCKMANGSIVELAKELNLTDRTIRTRWEEIQFKTICYIIVYRYLLLDSSVYLNALNRFPKLLKKHFYKEELNMVPSDRILRKVFKKGKDYFDTKNINLNIEGRQIYDLKQLSNYALAYDRVAKPVRDAGSNPGDPKFCSTLDFEGVRHRRPVVFINSYGMAYDHKTKQTRDLTI